MELPVNFLLSYIGIYLLSLKRTRIIGITLTQNVKLNDFVIFVPKSSINYVPVINSDYKSNTKGTSTLILRIFVNFRFITDHVG